MSRMWKSKSSPSHLHSGATVQRRVVRHYSSRGPAEPAPFLPIFRDINSHCPRGKTKKRVLPNQQQSSSDSVPKAKTFISCDAADVASLFDSQADFLDQALTPSTVFEDPIPLSSDLHSFRKASKKPSVKALGPHGREDPLSRRLLHLYMTSPQASIQSLVSYHSAFSNMQSTLSYNLILRLAIRHSAFGTAHAILQAMRASRFPEDVTTWKLCVRLLVREGRWPDAYNLVINPPKIPPRAPFVSDGVPVPVWAELFGTIKRRAFRGMAQIRTQACTTLCSPNLGISMNDTPPPQVVYASVAALLRMQQREAARRVATQFLILDPKGLGLRLLHLHVAAEPRRRTLMTFYRALRDLQGFRVVCPKLKPNSTTLFLLLGHLKGVKRCAIIGHKLALWFRRKWGNSVVSPEVEKRLLALAVKEKRVDLIRRWMTCVKTSRKVWWMWSLEREVVDGGIPKLRYLSRRPDLRLMKAGTEQLRTDRLLRRASNVLKSVDRERRDYVETGTR
ncbi:hypothetical protein B0F90DRAFT_1678123 [Multifurca ochricompacta]|uniref:Uncharacterized protein n=1 Tax=Multifurca ochricompacta TaxID=376703 RepID=A0AAD4ME30_9AGAM|nr:hypothetical protein B0F90DRAFT_1678123 [Multifurca ochricompacta]